MTSHGTTMLPSDLDIFLPSASAMCPRQSTVRYGELVEQQRRDRDQRVEPAARLVDRLADVVGGEALPRTSSSFSNGAWCWANGIEPESNQTSITSGTRRIGRRSRRTGYVERRRRRGGAGPSSVDAGLRLAARRTSPIALGVAVLAAPDRQRRAPVALARDRPVDVVLEPLAEAPVLDVLRVPVDGLVGGQQPVAQRRRADVPGRLGVVEQRRAAAPAVRVGVQVASRRAAAARASAGPRSGRGRRP